MIALAFVPLAVAAAWIYEALRRRLPAYQRYLSAKAALALNGDREQSEGITEETPEYLQLNALVWEAASDLPRWARFI